MCNCGGNKTITANNIVVPSNPTNNVQVPSADEIKRMHEIRAAQVNPIKVTPNISTRR